MAPTPRRSTRPTRTTTKGRTGATARSKRATKKTSTEKSPTKVKNVPKKAAAKKKTARKATAKKAPAKRNTTPAKAAQTATKKGTKRATPKKTTARTAKAKTPARTKSSRGTTKAGTAGKSAAGGGPVRMEKAEGAAPVRAYLAKLPAWQADLLGRFDDLVTKLAPTARRAVKWSAPFYGIPGQGWFASTKGFTKHVKITFFRGTSLRPVPPAGEHEQGRAIDLREGDTLDEKQMSGWIRQAAAMPGWGTS